MGEFEVFIPIVLIAGISIAGIVLADILSIANNNNTPNEYIVNTGHVFCESYNMSYVGWSLIGERDKEIRFHCIPLQNKVDGIGDMAWKR